MLASALSALGGRLDTKFLTAYWLPAFVAVLGSFGILAVIAGAKQFDEWIYNLDSVEQTLAVLLLVLAVTMLAFILRAISRPLTEVFAGNALPRMVAEWSTRGQRRVKHKAAEMPGAGTDRPEVVAATQRQSQWLQQSFPRDDAALQPTLFGNILATAAEYPRLVYLMDGLLWWPRLSPVVPDFFQEMLGGAQAPMMALLNLSVVFAGLAIIGAPLLVLAGGHWTAALVTLLGGLLLTRFCYRAAVSQAAELASMLRVGFDLYRHEILRQMDLEVPTDIGDERALWQKLTAEMLGLPDKGQGSGDEPDSKGAKSDAAPSH